MLLSQCGDVLDARRRLAGAISLAILAIAAIWASLGLEVAGGNSPGGASDRTGDQGSLVQLDRQSVLRPLHRASRSARCARFKAVAQSARGHRTAAAQHKALRVGRARAAHRPRIECLVGPLGRSTLGRSTPVPGRGSCHKPVCQTNPPPVTTPPDTQITSGPSGLTNNASPSFAFSSEAGASFQCRLDSTQAAGWALLQFAQALQLALQ